jgi:hypothetical protein
MHRTGISTATTDAGELVWHDVFSFHQLLANPERVFMKQKFDCRTRPFIAIGVKLQARLGRTLPIAALWIGGKTSLRRKFFSPTDHVFDITAQRFEFYLRHDRSQNVVTFLSELLSIDFHDMFSSF